MVLESLISPLKAEKTPFELFFFGFFYASLALLISLWVFDKYAGLVMVFLLVMPCVPLLYRTMKREERKDLRITSERSLLKEHAKVISFLLFLFIGAWVGFTVWYIALPVDTVQSAFEPQIETISDINHKISGNFNTQPLLQRIILNNLRVMIFCLLFSFLYGAGAIFILMWNASVIGTASGNFIRTHIAEYASVLGLQGASAYLYASSMSVVRFAIHGIPEILSYIVAGLAGGILSAAVINHDISTRNFERIMIDVANLVLIAIGLLLIGSFIEVYITPTFFL